MSFWGEEGITEDVALSVCKYCDVRHPILHLKMGERLDCNQPQRILIQDGHVYLTNLISAHYLGHPELSGFLLELYETSHHYRLPDAEFVVWFGEEAPALTRVTNGKSAWPYHPSGSMPPILHWSKAEDNGALLIPSAASFHCAADSYDHFVHRMKMPNHTEVAWKDKKEIAFGRWNNVCPTYLQTMTTADGQPMQCPRTHLPLLSKQHPDLLDAFDLDSAGPLPVMKHQQYKYLISTDGKSISRKLDKYMQSGSTVLKAQSNRKAFYYDAIKPYEHYLPFMVNSSNDIVDVINWAKTHDAEAQKIAENARAFANQHLNRHARHCYLYRLIQEISKKIKYQASCKHRRLCVPLVQELRFLVKFPKTRKTCRWYEIMHHFSHIDHAGKDRHYIYEETERLHDEGKCWPRDDLHLKKVRVPPPPPPPSPSAMYMHM
ncbi:hypothetical protein HYH03_010718 [Edaphochlamys debaryana]|uniref:Glycosyl transferase CAP10 domain-containing protein n=1 Tax=Edaphochlamys debaryana TaxID=47281 RepID=A0A836BVM6_9CHLO|nr:hypothetical protein HYH03_010718 [Edaphochlamys debaryana]|eukprot:KAG2490796.1 hypothetical protein HYH03_010718 [Edaphochlamys debaryana]